MTIRDQVTEFHEAFGAPVLTTPQVPPDDRVRLRLKLIAEEFCELLDACLGKPDARDMNAWNCWNELANLAEYIAKAPLGVDIVGVADALADLDYVIEGTRLEFGIDGQPIADEVHRSNMSKVGGVTREDGKIMKPPTYSPPDIAGELRKQSEKGSHDWVKLRLGNDWGFVFPYCEKSGKAHRGSSSHAYRLEAGEKIDVLLTLNNGSTVVRSGVVDTKTRTDRVGDHGHVSTVRSEVPFIRFADGSTASIGGVAVKYDPARDGSLGSTGR